VASFIALIRVVTLVVLIAIQGCEQFRIILLSPCRCEILTLSLLLAGKYQLPDSQVYCRIFRS